MKNLNAPCAALYPDERGVGFFKIQNVGSLSGLRGVESAPQNFERLYASLFGAPANVAALLLESNRNGLRLGSKTRV